MQNKKNVKVNEKIDEEILDEETADFNDCEVEENQETVLRFSVRKEKPPETGAFLVPCRSLPKTVLPTRLQTFVNIYIRLIPDKPT